MQKRLDIEVLRVNLKPVQADLVMILYKSEIINSRIDPLAELLGRSPRRMKSVSKKLLNRKFQFRKLRLLIKMCFCFESDSVRL